MVLKLVLIFNITIIAQLAFGACPTESFIEIQNNDLFPIYKKGQTLKIQKNFTECKLKIHKSDFVVLKNKNPKDPIQILKVYGRDGDRLKLKNNNFLINELYCQYRDDKFIANVNPLFAKLTKNKKGVTIIPKDKLLLFNELKKPPFKDSRSFGYYDESMVDAIVLPPKNKKNNIILPTVPLPKASKQNAQKYFKK